ESTVPLQITCKKLHFLVSNTHTHTHTLNLVCCPTYEFHYRGCRFCTSQLQVTESAKVSPAEEVAELERRREQLDTEIAQLEAEGYRVDELEHHIDMLHEYNDIKDIGQSLLGRIAALRGTTTRDLYAHFGLELDD
uniref:DNA repair protein SWI5 homolog n=1 Tax=Amphiprion percula TaxID=161767 RepID=A0A3P8SD18_AMPPE